MIEHRIFRKDCNKCYSQYIGYCRLFEKDIEYIRETDEVIRLPECKELFVEEIETKEESKC